MLHPPSLPPSALAARSLRDHTRPGLAWPAPLCLFSSLGMSAWSSAGSDGGSAGRDGGCSGDGGPACPPCCGCCAAAPASALLSAPIWLASTPQRSSAASYARILLFTSCNWLLSVVLSYAHGPASAFRKRGFPHLGLAGMAFEWGRTLWSRAKLSSFLWCARRAAQKQAVTQPIIRH